MRQLSIPRVSPSNDGILRIPVVLTAIGDEVNLEFGLTFDQSKYAFQSVVLSDVPVGHGYGTSSGGGWVNVGIVGNQPFSPGTHTVGEVWLRDLTGDASQPVIEFATSPRSVRDAGDYQLDATFYSANAPVTEFVMDAPQLTPIGAVINPTTGEVTVGHVDPVTGTVHVATENDGTIFGIQPIYLIAAAAVGLFLFTRN